MPDDWRIVVFSPYNEARRKFLKWWPYLSVFEKAHAIYLVSGERFWAWIGDSMHQKIDKYEKRNRLNDEKQSENTL